MALWNDTKAGVDYFHTYSPVLKPLTLRIMFTMVVTNGWKVQQVDINNAFLNGTLNEEVFIKQPEGFIDLARPNYVCKLKKALYGLKQASKAWYDTLHSFLTSSGFTHSVSDHCLFHHRINGKITLILVYVDDILITGDDSDLVDSLIDQLHCNSLSNI